MLSETDRKFLRIAYDEAKAGFDEGGCPIGSALAEGDRLIAQGRNQRVQQGDPSPMARWTACARPAARNPTANDPLHLAQPVHDVHRHHHPVRHSPRRHRRETRPSAAMRISCAQRASK